MTKKMQNKMPVKGLYSTMEKIGVEKK